MDKTKVNFEKGPLRWTHNYKLKDSDKTTPQGESMTVPGEAYTIKDLVKKFGAGMDPSVTKLGEYHGEDSFEDHDQPDWKQVSQSDMVDLDEVKAAAASQQLNLLQQMKDAELAREQKIRDDQQAQAKDDRSEDEPRRSQEDQKKAPRRSVKNRETEQQLDD